jgi:large subunit ribosomal protein L33
MAKAKKKMIVLVCGECKGQNYFLKKSPSVEEKLELQKFCKKCKKHTAHKETKV